MTPNIRITKRPDDIAPATKIPDSQIMHADFTYVWKPIKSEVKTDKWLIITNYIKKSKWKVLKPKSRCNKNGKWEAPKFKNS